MNLGSDYDLDSSGSAYSISSEISDEEDFSKLEEELSTLRLKLYQEEDRSRNLEALLTERRLLICNNLNCVKKLEKKSKKIVNAFVKKNLKIYSIVRFEKVLIFHKLNTFYFNSTCENLL